VKKVLGAVSKFTGIYNLILENKIITVCILFTFITVLESSLIVMGVVIGMSVWLLLVWMR